MEPQQPQSDPPLETASECRIRISRETQAQLRELFPEESPGDAVDFLVAKYRAFVGTAASVGYYESSIQMDRLEEIITLLAATNAELSTAYFSQIDGPIARLEAAALRISRAIPPHS